MPKEIVEPNPAAEPPQDDAPPAGDAPPQAGTPQKEEERPWFRRLIDWLRRNGLMVIEGLAAAGLAGFGIWHISQIDPSDGWIGLALIGLALLFYTMRGRLLSKLTIGKDSLDVEFVQAKIDEVKAEVQQAQQDAHVAKAVATQYGPPAQAEAGLDRLEVRRLGRSTAAGDWVHPGLKPRKKAPADDPQKYQWGEKPERNGRLLAARVVRLDRDWFEIVMTVTATGKGEPLPPGKAVRFHLHDTFSSQRVTVAAKNGVASLTRVAYGAFTVGAEVAGEPGTFLELDLATLVGAPAEFRGR